MTKSADWGAGFTSASSNAMQTYEDLLVPRMFTPWAELLLDQIALTRGEVALDVATGPGTVARVASTRIGPMGKVVGCDPSPAMLEIARAKPPVSGGAPIEYLECPADALTVADATYHVATCQQGLQFFPDKVAGLIEIRRALQPGRKLGVAVWCSLDDCPPFAAIERGVAAVLGPEAATMYRNGPWGLSDPDELTSLFDQAGFNKPKLTRHELPLTFEGGISQLCSSLAAAPVGAAVNELDDDRKRELYATIDDAAEPLVRDGAIESSMAAHIVIAVA